MSFFIRKQYHLLLTSMLSLSLVTPLYASGPVISHHITTKAEFEKAKNDLWNKYRQDAQTLFSLKNEYNNRALKFENKTMRFSLQKIGAEPKEGYPLYIALHGGGSAPSSVNDSQWEHMKIYYRDSVKNGIYVATRGITDNWNLHFEAESYPLYEKLIESAILFDHVNPNKVYLLGFSAGGDGVYQVVPKMPDRFAAANMSAGHHNWIKFDNLYNTPFLIQVGEYDSMYDRNHVAVKNYITLNELHHTYNDGYIHDVFVHENGSHNSWRDNDASHRNHPVMAYPVEWLAHDNREVKNVNTNAIDWLNQYTRQSIPTKLVWDLETSASKRTYQTGSALLGKYDYNRKIAEPKSLFYWLDVSVASQYPTKGKLVVEVVKADNKIRVTEANNIDKFRILLNPNLLDLSKVVIVEVDNEVIAKVEVNELRGIMVRTMLERSDKDEIYDAEIILAHNDKTNKWEIANA